MLDACVLLPPVIDLSGSGRRTGAGGTILLQVRAIRRLLSIGAGRLLALAIAAAAVAAVVIGLSGLFGLPRLVHPAYAAINVRDEVLHEVDVSDYGHSRYGAMYDREEGWLLPADGRARAIDIEGYERDPVTISINEWIITAKGHVFSRSCVAYFGCRVGSFVDGRSRWVYEGTERSVRGLGAGLFPGTLPGQYAQGFQAAYRVHAAVPKGSTTFAGKRVKIFQSMRAGFYVPSRGAVFVYWRPGTPPPATVRNAPRAAVLLTRGLVHRSGDSAAGWLRDVGLRARQHPL